MTRPRNRRNRRTRRPAPRRQLPVWTKAVFGLVVTVLFCLFVESGLRFNWIQAAYQPDRIGGWRMMSQMTNQRMYGVKERHSFLVTTNQDGMRTALQKEKTAGHKRVALMGDSIIFGWGADDGYTIADGLQAALDEHTDIGPIEILNAAQPGYSTTQVHRFFETVVRDYQPDLVVMFLPMHDHNLTLISDREHLDGADGITSGIRVLLANHSRSYQLLRQWFSPFSREAFLMPQDAEKGMGAPRVPRVSDDERLYNVRSIRDQLKETGGIMAVGHVPFMDDLTSTEERDRDGAPWAKAMVESEDVGMVDLRTCCGPDGADLLLSFDPGHFAPEGNVTIGRAAAEPILTLLQGSSR